MFTFKKPVLIAVSLLLVFSLLFLVNGRILAEETDFDELTTLSCKIEGTMQGEPAEFWYRIKNIGTEDEAFRLDATSLESEKSMGIIVNQANNSSFYKELSSESWMAVPFTMIRPFWKRYREEHIATIGGAEDWHRWAEADKNEFLLEEEDEHEGYTVKVYDIKVDEEIKDSVFTPDSS
ncbi:MAG: hypothetical protein ABEJ25_04200 [Candidatus Bipolaricaulia bacterium]